MITLKNISKWYGHFQVLTDCSTEVKKGEVVVVCGPSGSGKSTLIKTVNGLEPVQQGEIIVDGTQVNDKKTNLAKLRSRVGMVFQHFELFPHLSIIDNLTLAQIKVLNRDKESSRKKGLKLLERVGLAAHAEKYPAQLSGGQQQRVAIARAVVNKPRLLLLDESLSALDYKLRKQMQNELKALQRKLGITFVFVTHDQEEALTMSDRIVVMRDGKIEQDGTPREIYEEPKNLFVASFIGEINIFNATVIERLDEQRVRACVEGRECNIYVNFAVEKGQQLNVLLRPEDLRVDEIHHGSEADGLIGYVRERNYKGMTLESVVELENGKMVMVSEFFNEDDPDFDHSLDQKMAINWVESWEVVLADEEHQ
ncbi:spermidine/putrescine ABC transporter ATP-binding protein PotA [Klebsiella aerogenes]|uniref:spermidine/putrescine ABC transporter ATP-binding protein PotA n=2 Tax=Klebsiella TaxID=570 RepID=UPI001BCAA046